MINRILEILAIVFITLKVVGVIDWSWWLVLAPLLVTLGIKLAVLVGVAALVVLYEKNTK